MAISNNEFLYAAQNMMGQSAQEIDFRNSASRAYYAGFHKAREIANKRHLNIPQPGMSSHERLIKNLIGSSDPQIKFIGTLLAQCKKERTDADYKLHKLFGRNRAINVISQITQLLQIASSIP